MTTSKSKILFMMTGSIACYKACNTISKLVQSGFEVQVVASPAALQFIGPATLEGLSGKPVLTDLWVAGQAMDHIHLIRSADLIMLAPATANTINKMAGGIGDDLLTTLFLAHDFKKPFLIAPAMNTAMYLHPITQASMLKLKEMGIEILETESGVLACGEKGEGRLLNPDLLYEKIIEKIVSSLGVKNSSEPPLKVLITAGGTQEPIDDVRVLTNRSTGATGARLAERLFDSGMDVTLVHAASAVRPKRNLKTKMFETFSDLSKTLKESLESEKYDVIIHAAAVSDYSIENPLLGGKLSSDKPLEIKFKKNPKLVNEIKTLSNGAQLIAFKMTSTEDRHAQNSDIMKLFNESHADAIVHNDIREIDWKTGKHSFSFYRSPTSAHPESKIAVENVDHLADLIIKELT